MGNTDIRYFMPKRLYEVLGKNTPAIIEAFNGGFDTLEDVIQACIDQLFFVTASGKYLLTLGEKNGFSIPDSAGLDIRAFRVLVPIMVSNPKQVRFTIDDLIQAFYGSERTKANITSSVYGPYSLNDGDDLQIETESGSFSVNILANQVSDVSNVSALELSSIINYSQKFVLADTVVDRTNGLIGLRLTSKTQGTGSYIKVTGGKLQNVLKFPKLVDTTISSTTFNISKDSVDSDIVKFQWDGAGTSPSVYLAKPGDYITIRNLPDGMIPLNVFNGSYELLDVGYDYFKIRNRSFPYISGTVLVDNTNFVFTKNIKNTIFDKAEFAFSSENSSQTITITVPAVPPLTLRFLQGSAHLQGSSLDVVDFTRNTIQVNVTGNSTIPNEENQIVLSGPFFRRNFKTRRYKTILKDSNTSQPIYQLETGDENYEILPYVSATSVGNNPIYGTIGSSVYRLRTQSFRHGLKKSWGFTLDTSSGGSNLTTSELNKEHQVDTVINQNEITFIPKDSNGDPIKFVGFYVPSVDIYRHSAVQSDGSDCYIQFPSSAALLSAGFTVGDSFKFNPLTGTDTSPYGADIRYKTLSVVSITNTGSTHRVSFTAGIGIGPTGQIISGIDIYRSGWFGGATTYFFDKTSDYNKYHVVDGMRALFIDYTASDNPLYVGSYTYDPQGIKTQFTVSKYISNLTSSVLQGDSVTSIFVDSLSKNGDFPTTGQIVIGYGTNTLEGPIDYFATVVNGNVNQIIIDPAYKFKYSHDTGAKVQYIYSAKQYEPTTDGSDYPFYLTGTTAARNTMFSLIKLLVAAGIFVEQDLLAPELKNEDPSLSPFE